MNVKLFVFCLANLFLGSCSLSNGNPVSIPNVILSAYGPLIKVEITNNSDVTICLSNNYVRNLQKIHYPIAGIIDGSDKPVSKRYGFPEALIYEGELQIVIPAHQRMNIFWELDELFLPQQNQQYTIRTAFVGVSCNDIGFKTEKSVPRYQLERLKPHLVQYDVFDEKLDYKEKSVEKIGIGIPVPVYLFISNKLILDGDYEFQFEEFDR